MVLLRTHYWAQSACLINNEFHEGLNELIIAKISTKKLLSCYTTPNPLNLSLIYYLEPCYVSWTNCSNQIFLDPNSVNQNARSSINLMSMLQKILPFHHLSVFPLRSCPRITSNISHLCICVWSSKLPLSGLLRFFSITPISTLSFSHRRTWINELKNEIPIRWWQTYVQTIMLSLTFSTMGEIQSRQNCLFTWSL